MITEWLDRWAEARVHRIEMRRRMDTLQKNIELNNKIWDELVRRGLVVEAPPEFEET